MDDPAGESGRGDALTLHASHVYGDVAVRLDGDPLGPVTGPDLETVRVDEADVQQVAGEDPDPVPAHLRDAAVRVAIVHEPLGPFGGPRGRGQRLAEHTRAHHSKDTVAADTRSAVAQ